MLQPAQGERPVQSLHKSSSRTVLDEGSSPMAEPFRRAPVGTPGGKCIGRQLTRHVLRDGPKDNARPLARYERPGACLFRLVFRHDESGKPGTA
jgi:hypothetical protein